MLTDLRHALLQRKARSQNSGEPRDISNYPPQQSIEEDDTGSKVCPFDAENSHFAVEPLTGFNGTPDPWSTPIDPMESLSHEVCFRTPSLNTQSTFEPRQERNDTINTYMESFESCGSIFMEQLDPPEHSDGVFNLHQKTQLGTCNPSRRATPTMTQIQTDFARSDSDASTSTVDTDAVTPKSVKTIITIDDLDAITRAEIVNMVLEKRGQISITTE